MSKLSILPLAAGLILLTACAATERVSYSQTEAHSPALQYELPEVQPRQYAGYHGSNSANVVAAASPRVKPAPSYAQRSTSVQGYPKISYSVAGQKSVAAPTFVRASNVTSDPKGALTWSSHVVEQGDTAYSLSRRFCSRTSDIKKYNGLDSDYSLKVGQAIILPRTSC